MLICGHKVPFSLNSACRLLRSLSKTLRSRQILRKKVGESVLYDNEKHCCVFAVKPLVHQMSLPELQIGPGR